MTADTEGGVEDMAKTGGRVVDSAGMRGWGLLILVAIQAINLVSGCALVGVSDDVPDLGAGWRHRIDVAGGVVAGGASSIMSCHDIRPVEDRVAVGAVLIVGLRLISGQVEFDVMIDRTAGLTVVVAGEISGMAGDAFAGVIKRQTLTQSRIGVVAGGAAARGMDLSAADKGRGGGGVAAQAHAVGCRRGESHVLGNPACVVVVVIVEVPGMAFEAGAAGAAIDPGIAVAIGPVDPGAGDV